jgi:hypothetical protein
MMGRIDCILFANPEKKGPAFARPKSGRKLKKMRERRGIALPEKP